MPIGGKYGSEKAYKGVDGGKEYSTGPYESQAEPRAAFAAMVSLLDQQVGEIIAKIDALCLADNTIIIFTSDNGPPSRRGRQSGLF